MQFLSDGTPKTPDLKTTTGSNVTRYLSRDPDRELLRLAGSGAGPVGGVLCRTLDTCLTEKWSSMSCLDASCHRVGTSVPLVPNTGVTCGRGNITGLFSSSPLSIELREKQHTNTYSKHLLCNLHLI